MTVSPIVVDLSSPPFMQGMTAIEEMTISPCLTVSVIGTGSLSISSTPPGAVIFIDGVDQGAATPYILSNIPEGQHTVTLKIAGYNDFTTDVTVIADQTLTVPAALVPAEGCISFNSTPAGARVILDGTDTGKATPSLICGLSLDKHTYMLVLSGYKAITKTVDLVSSHGETITETMVSEKGVSARTMLGISLLGVGVLGVVVYASRDKEPSTAREYLKYVP